LLKATMTKREGEVGDIAAAIHFLASPAARHITAQVLHVNGGALSSR
jgi:3-oxoacyl-[acyl-carrier protein] reductase